MLEVARILTVESQLLKLFMLEKKIDDPFARETAHGRV